MVILGPATNEVGANCWVGAYDINTGKELWRFYTGPIGGPDPRPRPGQAIPGSTAAAPSGTAAPTILRPT